MRSVLWPIALGVFSTAAAQTPNPLTFDDILARAASDPAALARKADLARIELELAAAGRRTREGPTLGVELGPRYEAGEHDLQATAQVEFPLRSKGATADAASERLHDAHPAVLAAEAVTSRLRLRTAYLDSWLEQEHLAVLEQQIDTVERVMRAVRARAEAGAEAPYEVALAEGELLRARSQADAAREARGEAWSRLRMLADLPEEPATLASPGLPDLHVPDDARGRFETGALRLAVERRSRLDMALLDLTQAQGRSRWAIVGGAGREGDESFATVGAAYRIPRRGEDDARERERSATVASLTREADAEANRLATIFASALERVRRFGPLVAPDSFDDALGAVALRIELGKDRLSVALPVRRQILEARGEALERIRDGHELLAQIAAMTAGEQP